MRRRFFYILFLFLALNTPAFIDAQSTSVNNRTPEQEATKQTEKMQKELNLNLEQAKKIYEINLKYARERKQSNNRADAVNRIKNKNEEIKNVLNDTQYNELQSKRSETLSVEINGTRRYTRIKPENRVNTTPSTRRPEGAPFYQQNFRNNESTDATNRPVRPMRTDSKPLPRNDMNNGNDDKKQNEMRPAQSTRRSSETNPADVNRNTTKAPPENKSKAQPANSDRKPSIPPSRSTSNEQRSNPATSRYERNSGASNGSGQRSSGSSSDTSRSAESGRR